MNPTDWRYTWRMRQFRVNHLSFCNSVAWTLFQLLLLAAEAKGISCINHGPHTHTFSTIGCVPYASSVTHAASATRGALLLDLFWLKMQLWMKSSQGTVREWSVKQLRCRWRRWQRPNYTLFFSLLWSSQRQHKSFSGTVPQVLSVSKRDLRNQG